MGIYVKLNPRSSLDSRKDVLLGLTEYVLTSLNVQINNFAAFNEYPNESIGDITHEISDLLSYQTLFNLEKDETERLFIRWFNKSDYIKIKGSVNSIPCVLVVTSRIKGFEHEDFYFEFYTKDQEYGNKIFTKDNEFNEFAVNLVKFLETSSDVVRFAFIGHDVEVIEEWNRAWMIWYYEDYDFIYDLISFLGRISKLKDFQRDWLKVSSRDLIKVIELLRYLRKDLVAGAYAQGKPLLKMRKRIWSKKPSPKVTPIHEYILTEQSLGITADYGSLFLSCSSPGSFELQEALNRLLVGIIGSINRSVDIDQIGRSIAENAIIYFKELRKS